MNKKILLSLFFAVASTVVHAAQTISVVWPFNIGSTQANYARTLIAEANRLQNKYVFVLENRTGAGSSIAANHVANSKEPAIMAATSSFFIRPNFFPTSSHNIDQFRPLMIQCAVPMIVVSKKYQSLKGVDSQTRITVGVSGLGTTTHLLTAELKKRFPNITAVAYTGTMEPIKDVLGGNLDMAVGFPGELKQFVDSGQLHVIGISGPNNLGTIMTLKRQGFDGAELVVNTHFLAVSKATPDTVFNEWKDIMNRASKSVSVKDAYAVDNCIDGNVDTNRIEQWFGQQIQYWQKVTTGIKIDQ